MERIITFIFATMLAGQAWAADFLSGKLLYNITSDTEPYTVEVARKSSHYNMTTIEIPEYVYYNSRKYTVTGIGQQAFYGEKLMTSVTIPNTITSIGISAFSDCTGLTTITIPNSVTNISSAFGGCNLTYNEYDNAYYLGNSENPYHALIKVKSNDITSCEINNKCVVIAAHAYDGCSNLTSIVIPNSVKSISGMAFYECINLVKAEFASIESLCGIKFGDAAANPLRYAHHLFINGTEITDLIIPNAITSICDYAFYGCSNLISVSIPSSMTNIGKATFVGCSGLTKAEFASIESLCGINFSNYNANPLANAHHLYINGNEITEIVIPDNITSIGGYAFFGCNSLTSVNIPNSVTFFGNGAFGECNALTTITTNCDSVGNAYLYFTKEGIKYCVLAKNEVAVASNYINGSNSYTGNVTIPEIVTAGNTFAVKSIAKRAFYDCNDLTSVKIPAGITKIDDYTFSGSGITSINIPNSVTGIGNNAFSNCGNLTSVTIGDSIKSIGYEAFSNCRSLSEISIPDSDTIIGINAFYGCCSLTSIIIPNSIKNISARVFQGCNNLASVTISDGIKSIGAETFSGCRSLTSITIPNSVESIGSGAFSGCNNLSSITLPFVGDKRHAATDEKKYSFGFIFGTNYDEECTKTVQDDKYYYIPTNLKNVIITSCDYIPDKAFINCNNITSITIPNTVTSIYDMTFYNCSKLTSIIIPNNVISIGKYAFCGCEDLVSATIGPAVKSIGNNAFSGCSNLELVSIPDSVTEIGNSVFYNCTALESATISNAVESIGDKMFFGCTKLKTITIGNSVTKISDNAFNGCSSLTSIVIPNSVTSIGENAFNNCENLTAVGIPNSVTSIGQNAFNSCYGLTSISIPNSVTEIGYGAFKDCINLTIYCQAKIKHSNWNKDWNISGCPVEWGVNLKSVTVKSDNDEHGFVSGSGVYIDNFTLTLTAIPAAGYHFVGWSDGNTDNPRQTTVTRDSTFEALFEANKYSIAVNAENGAITGAATYNFGDTVILTATANEGYHFVKWSDGNTDNPRTIVVSQELTISAVFESNENQNQGEENQGGENQNGEEEQGGESENGNGEGNGENIEPATAVAESAANAVNIYAHGNTIVVENATEEIYVYNAMGALVGRDVARNISTIKINNTGVYIVKTGNMAKRIIIN